MCAFVLSFCHAPLPPLPHRELMLDMRGFLRSPDLFPLGSQADSPPTRNPHEGPRQHPGPESSVCFLSQGGFSLKACNLLEGPFSRPEGKSCSLSPLLLAGAPIRTGPPPVRQCPLAILFQRKFSFLITGAPPRSGCLVALSSCSLAFYSPPPPTGYSPFSTP